MRDHDPKEPPAPQVVCMTAAREVLVAWRRVQQRPSQVAATALAVAILNHRYLGSAAAALPLPRA